MEITESELRRAEAAYHIIKLPYGHAERWRSCGNNKEVVEILSFCSAECQLEVPTVIGLN